MMIPAFASVIVIAFSRLPKFLNNRLILIFLLSLIIGEQIMINTPITLVDGIYGLSSRRPSPANDYINQHYDYGLVIFDDYSRPANPIDLKNIPFNKIIYIGNHPIWYNSLIHPSRIVRWIIMQRGDTLCNTYVDNKEFIQKYNLVYSSNQRRYLNEYTDLTLPDVYVYKLIDSTQ